MECLGRKEENRWVKGEVAIVYVGRSRGTCDFPRVSLWFYLRDFSIVYSVFPVQQNLIDSRAPTNFDYVTLRWLQFVIVHILTYLHLSGLRKLEPNNKALLKYPLTRWGP